MSSDYRVPSRSDAEIKQLAQRYLTWAGASRRYPVNVLALLGRASIWTVFGVKSLTFKTRADGEMEDRDAQTTATRDAVIIEAKESVVSRARVGVGRDRQTLAHELGHGVMHERPLMARQTGAVGVATPRYLKPYESAEHQAKVFAPALLIIEELATALMSAEDISAEFGVSLQSAKIYFDRLTVHRDRGRSADRVRDIAEDFRRSIVTPEHSPSFLAMACPNCGERQLQPIGIKVLCKNCDFLGDIPDGEG